MHWLILILVLLALVAGPSWWVRRVMRRYAEPADRYPSTGADLARHLLDQQGLGGVPVEETAQGDHYDPLDRAVRLSSAQWHGRSLTAVTVAAHEVGHALQDAEAYGPLRWRTRLVRLTQPLQKIGAFILLASPLVALLTRMPVIASFTVLGGLLSLGAASLVHLVTLPTEFDASFRRALPLLHQEGILRRDDLPHARRILTAAALTYVAASLASLLNVARWFALLRR